jgi:hypothetical protein
MGLNTGTARVSFCLLYTHGPYSSDFPVTEFSPRYSSIMRTLISAVTLLN